MRIASCNTALRLRLGRMHRFQRARVRALHDAIRKYDFFRKDYPGSRYRFSALLTEGEIYLRDLNDREAARATFQQFLKLYPRNPLADEARIELSGMRHSKRGSTQELASMPR